MPVPDVPPAAVVRSEDRADAVQDDPVEQNGLDSFPASDPPSWWSGGIEPPAVQP